MRSPTNTSNSYINITQNFITIISVKISGLNVPIKKHRAAGYIRKSPNSLLFIGTFKAPS